MSRCMQPFCHGHTFVVVRNLWWLALLTDEGIDPRSAVGLEQDVGTHEFLALLGLGDGQRPFDYFADPRLPLEDFGERDIRGWSWW